MATVVRDECAVCLESSGVLRTLPQCRHAMHSHCLLRVLAQHASMTGGSKAPCPCCRRLFSWQSCVDNAATATSPGDWSDAEADAETRMAFDEFRRAIRDFKPPAAQRRPCHVSFCCFLLMALGITLVGVATAAAVYTIHPMPPPSSGHRAGSASSSAQRTPSLRECEALLVGGGEPQGSHGSHSDGSGGGDDDASIGADPEALGALAGWALFGGPFGELIGGAMGRWVGEQRRVALAEAERRGACTIEWLTQASRSLDVGRPLHAVSHARKAVRLSDGLAGHATSSMRPHALFTLVRALEAANSGEPTAESQGLLRDTARLGHSSAQVELAERLEVADPASALEWYARGAPGAADGGIAWRRLGVMLLTGIGLEGGAPSYERAADAFETASGLGDAEAAYNLGRMYEWRQTKGTPVPKPADATGDGAGAEKPETSEGAASESAAEDEAVAAEVDALGGSARPNDGEPGGGSDPKAGNAAREKRIHSVEAPTAELAAVRAAAEWREQSLRLYRLAAERGLAIAHPAAARLLLLRAHTGDAQAACAHYMAAAAAHDADSQWELAGLLRDGVGCERDSEAAERWFAAAADNGHPAALARAREAEP